MEEPQISDFYNKMPSMVKVIDGMNKELSDVQDELSNMKDKYEPIVVIDDKKFNNDFIPDVDGLLSKIITYGCRDQSGFQRLISILVSYDHDDKGHVFKFLKDYYMHQSKNEEYSNRISKNICTNMMAISKMAHFSDCDLSLEGVKSIIADLIWNLVFMSQREWKEKCSECENIFNYLWKDDKCQECYERLIPNAERPSALRTPNKFEIEI